MGDSKKAREFTLDNGEVYTTATLRAKLGVSHSTAYARLVASNRASSVLKPGYPFEKRDGLRLYLLDDGSKWTSRMVAEHTGCKISTASTRLSNYSDPAKVLSPPKTIDSDTAERILERIQERMYFDPLGHWKLLNKAL